MSEEFLKALKAEIAQLTAALERDERFLRLGELKRVLALYEKEAPAGAQAPVASPSAAQPKRVVPSGAGSSAPTPAPAAASVAPPAAPVRRSAGGRKASPERERALREVEKLIADRGAPVPTREIAEHLGQLGIKIAGKNLANAVSAMMSNAKQFRPKGREGWTVVSPRAA